jgi:hypothetical protein
MGAGSIMAKSTDRDWHQGSLGRAPREVSLSKRLATLAREAEAGGFPFTAEHLRHLASGVLDEAALKYSSGQTDGDAV